MDNYIGKKLDGRYEIEELIGSGGMANVYKAVDRMDGSVRAVKILREEFLDNEELVRRFKNESKAIALLSHPNIVKVFDVNFSDSIQYIVMEYLDGITLKQYIEHQKKLSWKDTVHFITQTLRALQHAHDRGIVHRDIKPQNIMMMANGDIKVTDFGIARFSRSETRTITDKAIGSVHYISPEQAKGDITDAKADIYSVGVMMYEMLTGTLPFVSDSAVSVAIKQISDNPKTLREIDDTIPEGLEEITLKAMAKDPAKRYQSAAQMLRDIEDFKKNPSIVFEYKYFGNESPTVYIDNTKAASGSSKQTVKSSDGKQKSASSGKQSTKRNRENLPMAILLGITGACVVGAAILLLMVFSLSGMGNKYEDVDLPNFVGKNITEIEGNAEYKNFKFKVVEDFNSSYELGVVYSQSPIPPKKIKENGEITLHVSKGPEKITIPDVSNMTYTDGVAMLQNLGLKVGQESIADTEFQGGRIVKSDPVSGTEVMTGSKIIVYVNQPSASSEAWVPVLVDFKYNQAKSLLSEAGLKLGTVTEKESEKEKGIVLEQSIAAGKSVAKNTTIDLVISAGIVPKLIKFSVELPCSVSGAYDYSVSAEGGAETYTYTATNNYAAQAWEISEYGNGEKTFSIYVNAGTKLLLMTVKVNFETGEITKTKADNAAFGFTPDTPPEVTISSSTLSFSTTGATQQLSATVGGAASSDVTWSSDNEAVATVDANGLVTSVTAGTANITVKANKGGKTGTCAVTVTI